MKRISAYVKKMEDSQIFDNGFSQAFPQTDIAKICEKHALSGKRKKVLLIAFDAVRSDALLNIVASANKDKYPHSENVPGSGISTLKSEGGLYFLMPVENSVIKKHGRKAVPYLDLRQFFQENGELKTV